MLRSVILGLVVAGVLVLGLVGYRNWCLNHDMMSGEVKNGPAEPGDSAAAAPVSPPVQTPAARQGSPAKSSASEMPSTPASVPVGAPTTFPAAVPAGDTIAPNPPNGFVYAGAGRFEVYRQGNLTWRINTYTGKACVLFATNEEWRKPQVYRHGCGAGALQ